MYSCAFLKQGRGSGGGNRQWEDIGVCDSGSSDVIKTGLAEET